MFTSSKSLKGTLTLVHPNADDYYDIEWNAPLDNEAFNSDCTAALERAKLSVADTNVPLREYLAEKVLDAYEAWAAIPVDFADPKDVEAEYNMKVWLRALSNLEKSPFITFFLAHSRVFHIDVAPLPDPETIARFEARTAELLERITKFARGEGE